MSGLVDIIIAWRRVCLDLEGWVIGARDWKNAGGAPNRFDLPRSNC